ncbi:PilN domain-containing protein [Desulfuromonas acetoxidans]|uniref:Fimbrial assembly n=1 Tax=Desulfuromonas acetoxidans (strain DSM 684 / 11070) TaxID=281689 RepID=Q1K2X1_DESA6|nr:PilN domain-containing protein [Desulfuromonas acetoxidans]EAT16760.1 Fimbrial assembly [Desulfuromonas acetoxidans DSM 684]MBF0644780.1 PilN domain-containing protein [Desulfuromonas acetoxidans]NVD23702.1 PilN domain-containing protein [Desulfuromonas acetoxidans]NVE15913.1 PilN domain-containing protein [Desulfuromonas acetoxidans]
MIRINLLPVKAAQKKEQLRNQFVVAGVALAIIIVGCVVMQMSIQSDIDTVKSQIRKNKAEIKSLQKKIGEVNKFKALQEELKNKLDVLETLKKAKSGPVHIMDDLITALPDNLWVTDFKEKGGNITLKGVGLSEDDVADFMTNLDASAYYKNVRLKVTKQKTSGGLRLQNFELSCKVEQPSSGVKK